MAIFDPLSHSSSFFLLVLDDTLPWWFSIGLGTGEILGFLCRRFGSQRSHELHKIIQGDWKDSSVNSAHFLFLESKLRNGWHDPSPSSEPWTSSMPGRLEESPSQHLVKSSYNLVGIPSIFSGRSFLLTTARATANSFKSARGTFPVMISYILVKIDVTKRLKDWPMKKWRRRTHPTLLY